MPQVSEYLDVLQFLNDYFKARKNENAKFSYDVWAKELSFKSKSYLRMILLGRRKITSVFENAFAKSARFSDEEKSYFHFLILYSQAIDAPEKQLYSKKMIEILRQSVRQTEITNYFEFLADPQLPTLLVLLSFKDLVPTAETLAKFMRTDIQATTARLQKLKSLSLVRVEDANGEQYWRAQVKNFKVPSSFGNLALENYHRENLKEAARALGEDPNLRRFRTLLLPLGPNELNEFFKMADEFATSLLARHDVDQLRDRQMFKVNLQIYPA